MVAAKAMRPSRRLDAPPHAPAAAGPVPPVAPHDADGEEAVAEPMARSDDTRWSSVGSELRRVGGRPSSIEKEKFR